MKRKILLFITIILVNQGFSQTWVDNALKEIEGNNPLLKSGVLWKEAKQAEASTGITPANPFVEAGWFPAEEKGAGMKKTWGISQSFDFPTLYFQKVKKANTSKAIADVEYRMLRQEVLLDAKSTLIEFFYEKQVLIKLKERVEQTQQLVGWFQKRVETGDASALDLNNARTRLLNINDRLIICEANIEVLTRKLVQLNGGKSIPFGDALITIPILPNRDSIITALKANDPRFTLLSLNGKQSVENLNIAKGQWLPNFEVGYESEKTKAETFTGFRVGLSIPLWGNAGQVKAAKAKRFAVDAEIVSVESQLLAEIEKEYLSAKNAQQRFINFTEFLKSCSNISLLRKSLELGNISAINYFNEVEYLYDIQDKGIETEKELVISITKLERFKL